MLAGRLAVGKKSPFHFSLLTIKIIFLTVTCEIALVATIDLRFARYPLAFNRFSMLE